MLFATKIAKVFAIQTEALFKQKTKKRDQISYKLKIHSILCTGAQLTFSGSD